MPTDWKEEAGKAWAAPGWRKAAEQYEHDRAGRRPLTVEAEANGQQSPKPDSQSQQRLLTELAKLSRFEYDRCRKDEAKKLGIKVDTLDREVAAARAHAENRSAELSHWKVDLWEAPVEGAGLLADIERVFTCYAFLPTGASVALALWTLHAWTMDAGDISPFLVLVSPTKRCGKTTVLIVLYYLTPRSELASNISPSALFRYVEDIRPTLLIDEADSFMKDNEELRGILNSGHTKAAAHVIRNVEINGEHKPRRFSTWAPKAIATIRELADTLEDRAIVLMLQRKPRGAKVERLRKRDSDEFAVLRRKAGRWAKDNFSKLADPDPKIPDVLNDRAADNWRPLLAIADLANGEWPTRAREAACVLSGDGHDVASVNVELLADIWKAFGESEVMTSADLVAALVADPERPWATWGKGDKPLTQNQLARLLRPFAIISETVHPLGRPHVKGYKRSHFEEAWAGYVPGQNPSPQPTDAFKACNRANADQTGITRDFQSVQEAPPHGLKNGDLSYGHAGLHACTFQSGGSDGKEDSATSASSGNGHAFADYPDLPESLRRPPPRLCDHCGTLGILNPWNWPGRPDGITLHSSCKGPWFDSEARR
jgi:putative DNA primase/helicase